MKRFYKGCENAASATAKVIYNYLEGQEVFYFGDEEEAIDSLLERKVGIGEKTIFHYEIYNKPIIESDNRPWLFCEGGYSNAYYKFIRQEERTLEMHLGS